MISRPEMRVLGSRSAAALAALLAGVALVCGAAYVSDAAYFSNAVLLAGARPEPAPMLEIHGRTMGTTYSVKVAGATEPADGRRLRAVVEAELRAVDESMSTYDPDSELSRFNRHASTEPFSVSRPIVEVFRAARAVSEMTGGAFDVTVGPLVAAWGFGATDRVPAPPTALELSAARRRVGYNRVAIDSAAGALRKSQPDVDCDLSGVAKGYAVDRAVGALAAIGYGDVLVEVGGDLRAAGHRGDGEPWQVAIERPVAGRGTLQRRLSLSDRALATSGDYRNYYESEGRRLSHLIDPRTGRPIENLVASVSVVHASSATADALATALSVLGAGEGIRLAEERGLAVLFLVRTEKGIEEIQSSAFAKLAAE